MEYDEEHSEVNRQCHQYANNKDFVNLQGWMQSKSLHAKEIVCKVCSNPKSLLQSTNILHLLYLLGILFNNFLQFCVFSILFWKHSVTLTIKSVYFHYLIYWS